MGATVTEAVTAAATEAALSPAGSGRRPTIAVLAVQGAFIEHERRLRELGCDVVELRQRRDLDQPFDGLVLPGGESTAQGKLLADLGMLDPLRQRILDGLPVLGTCAGMVLLARTVEGAGDVEGLDPSLVAGRTTVQRLATLPCTVVRNGYGRQLGSFVAYAPFGTEKPGERAALTPNPDAALRVGALAAPTAPAAPADHPDATPRVDAPAKPVKPTAAARNPDATPSARPVIPLVFIRAPYISHVGEGCEVLVRVDGRIVAVRYKNQLACAFHPELTQDNTVYQEFLSLL